MNKSLIIAISAVMMFSCGKHKNKHHDDDHKHDGKGKHHKKEMVDLNGKYIQGASVLAFGPDNVLFIGDSKAGMIHAIPTTGKEEKEPTPYNIYGIDKEIGKKLGIPPFEVVINDMQINPTTQEAYIAVQRGNKPGAKSVIAVVNPKTKAISFLNTDNKTSVKVNNVRTDNFKFYKSFNSSKLNITDIDYNNGFLYVAGLTNGEFASTLRKIAYPFNDKQESVAGIEMWHTVHTQMETRAPIRTMLFEEVAGESTLLAAYTCTPLVTIPTSEIKEGNHIKAKTIAELGYGNTPIDMISFMAQEQDGSYDKKLLIINKERSASLISVKELVGAKAKKGMDGFSMGPEGLVTIFPVPMAGTMHIAEQNAAMLGILNRNIDNGTVDLLSQFKGAYFRLSHFQSEYEFPDHSYRDGEPWKDFHNMAKKMEGHADSIKE